MMHPEMVRRLCRRDRHNLSNGHDNYMTIKLALYKQANSRREALRIVFEVHDDARHVVRGIVKHLDASLDGTLK